MASPHHVRPSRSRTRSRRIVFAGFGGFAALTFVAPGPAHADQISTAASAQTQVSARAGIDDVLVLKYDAAARASRADARVALPATVATTPQPQAPTAKPAAAVRPAAVSLADSRAAAAVRFAYAQLGKPYRFGAAGPSSFDCSGLTMRAWGAAGVSLGHNAAGQYASTHHISRAELRPGDLVFFGHSIHHEGIYIGGGRFIEAPYTGARVQISSLSSRSDFAGASRP